MLTKEQKREQYEQLRESLDGVKTLFLLQNTGLSVNEINELRSEVRGTEATYKVYKNSVVRLAVEGTSMEGLSQFLTGPNAIAFTAGDGVALAKVLKKFIKEHPKLELQRAFLEGQILDAGEAAKLADMPSREELLTKVAFLLQSPIRRLAVALNSPLQNLVSVVSQIADSKEEQGS
jgi:large subunit ribosomal protein L10